MQAISPLKKQNLRSWLESAQDLLREEADEARRRHHTALLEEVESNWDLPNWASNVEQCVSQYGHALANTQPLLKPPRRSRSHQHGVTTYIDMQKVGTRQSLPAGFMCRDPALASRLKLIKFAELLRDLSRPESRADSDEVGSDIKIILTLKGDLVTKNLLSHSRPGGLQSPVLGSHSPKASSNAIRGENLPLPNCCLLKRPCSDGQALSWWDPVRGF